MKVDQTILKKMKATVILNLADCALFKKLIYYKSNKVCSAYMVISITIRDYVTSHNLN